MDSENSAELTGEAMDEGEFRSAAANSESIMIDTHKSIVCTFFGEHEMGAELALKMGEDLATVLVGSPHVAIHQFYKGISYFAMARKTKKGKYKRAARKAAATVKKWWKKGCPNLHHLDSFLDAELAAMTGRKQLAKKLFQQAIVMAARGGSIHYAALANERYGEFLLYEMDDKEEATFRLEEAIKYYLDWGAYAKSDSLRETYRDLWPKPIEIII